MNGVAQTAKGAGRTATNGRISEWNEAKGYGWVDAGGKRLFAHIKEFDRGQRRPVAGDEVSFTPGTDGQGRSRATALRLTKQAGRIGIGAWLLFVVLLVLPLLAGLFLPVPGWVLPVLMVSVSVAAWFSYRSDKHRAEAGGWRVSEASLHLLELLGGWPGAFLAQRKF